MKTNSSKLDEFVDIFLLHFNDFSVAKLDHWNRFGRVHTNFDSCKYFHSENFDGFVMWLIERKKNHAKTKTPKRGEESERMGPTPSSQTVERY